MGEVAKPRAKIRAQVPAILDKPAAAAQAGDVQAARLLLERVLPPIKAAEDAVQLPLVGDTLTDQGRAVLAAAGAGDLAPGQAAALLGALGTLAKIVETDEIMRRPAALEAKTNERTNV